MLSATGQPQDKLLSVTSARTPRSHIRRDRRRLAGAGGQGRGDGQLRFGGGRVSVLQDEGRPVRAGDGCTATRTDSASLNRSQKTGSRGEFLVHFHFMLYFCSY